VLLVSTVGCDRLTKQIARDKLASAEPVLLLNNTIRLEYTENRGAFLSVGERLPRSFHLFLASSLGAMVIFNLVRLSLQKRDVEPAILAGLSPTMPPLNGRGSRWA